MKELYGITTEDIEETRSWEEGRVTIDIDKKTLDFDVLDKWEVEDINEMIKYDDLGKEDIIEINRDFKNILFEDVFELKAFIDKSIYNGKWYYYNKFNNEYISLEI